MQTESDRARNPESPSRPNRQPRSGAGRQPATKTAASGWPHQRGAPTWKDRVRADLRGASFEDGQRLVSARHPAETPERPVPAADPALAAFLARGLYGPMHLRAPTGRGGFEVSYAPAAEVELLRIGGGVSFRDAVGFRGGRAFSELPNLRSVVRQINEAPEEAQPGLLRPYQWTSSAQAAWLARLEAVVEGFWSGVFRFRVNRPGWGAVRARTAVDVDVHEGPKRADDHLSIEVFQVPDTVNAEVGVLASGQGPLDNRMQLGASDVAPRPDNMLQERDRKSVV